MDLVENKKDRIVTINILRGLEMFRKVLIHAFCLSVVGMSAFSSVTAADTLYAGIRCSEYGFSPMPTTTWIGTTCGQMVKRFQKSGRVVIPCVVWITSTFSQSVNNKFLTYFDQNGIKALLQVEPYEDPVVNWIDDELTLYKSHPCIIGFGIDVEWYYPEENDGLGRKVTDNDARTWRTKVKSYNSNYLFLLKHFFPAWCPSTERTGIVFLDDSQQFPSFERFLNETNPQTKWNIGYRVWGSSFATGIVGMQYGYDDNDGGPSDKVWWIKLKDPQKEIGDSCIQVGPNTRFLFWVDFTSQDPDVDWDFITDIKNDVTVSPLKACVSAHNRIISVRNFAGNGRSYYVSLFSANGKIKITRKYENVIGDLSLKLEDNFPSGIYLVKVHSGRKTVTERVSIH